MKKVFIIHGWTYNLDKWTDLVNELKKSSVEPVLLKVPGLTESSDKVWDIDGYVSWLDEKLEGSAEPIVIGHSNGGRIALAYAQQHPERLKQLILIDSAGLAHHEAPRRAKLATLRVMSKAGKPLAKIPLLRKGVYKAIGAQDYRDAAPNMRLTMQNMLKADNLLDFHKITVPTTIIWGRNDAITPLSDGQKMHDLLTGSALYIIEDARHSPMATKPAEAAAIIMKALK